MNLLSNPDKTKQGDYYQKDIQTMLLKKWGVLNDGKSKRMVGVENLRTRTCKNDYRRRTGGAKMNELILPQLLLEECYCCGSKNTIVIDDELLCNACGGCFVYRGEKWISK